MSRLGQRLARLIAAQGPISVADYMAACLFDPEDGYYTTQEPFGVDGDFVTAPEVSQMFGELVAIWVRLAWHAMGRPLPVTIVEIGPGRGTLMADMLRTFRKLEPHLFTQARIAMVEASPRLTDVQRAALSGIPARLEWHAGLDTLSTDTAVVFVANELFDAIPVRQFVKIADSWSERVVALDDAGRLILAAGAGSLDPILLPPGADTVAEGSIVEVAPARSALMETISTRIAECGGAGLFIDYGSLRPGFGDTLQAVSRHHHDDVLAQPGAADLTTHVDFHALAAVAEAHGLRTEGMSQGEFLLGLGLLERAGRLGAAGDEALRERLAGEVERLAGTTQMGDLFKVLAVAGPGLSLWPIDRNAG